jgi:uncharacterized protein (DUF1697 family)
MHLLTLTELHRLRVNQQWEIKRMVSEQTIVLDSEDPYKEIEEKFDFYVEMPKKTVGFEVLTEPSEKEMLEKLDYSKEVDEFVFVIPTTFLKPYKKEKNNEQKVNTHRKNLSKEFSKKGLYVWLISLGDRRIVNKQPFSDVYYIEDNENGQKAS